MVAAPITEVTGTARDSRTSGAAASALVHRETRNPPSVEDHQRWRRERFERRRISSKLVIEADRLDAGASAEQWIRPRRVARCSWRLGETVGVHHGPSGAHLSGTERCASIWACPVCSAVIRAERAAEIETGVVAHLDAGGGALFVTGTIRHAVGDLLETGLNAVIEGWTRVIRGNPWKKWAERIGLVGIVRSVEVTYGHVNGWHPHLHGLLLLKAPISDEMTAAFMAWIADRWRTMVTKLGADEPSDEYGFKVRAVGKDGRVLAKYLAKMQEHAGVGVGSELARGDLKSARSQTSLMPFELLDSAFNNPEHAALWLDYLDATAGRQCITFSRGLRDLLGLGEDRTDEQLIEDSESAEMVGVLDGDTYDELRKQRRVCDLLDQIEAASRGDRSGDLLHLLAAPPECANDVVDRTLVHPSRVILPDLRRYGVKKS